MGTSTDAIFFWGIAYEEEDHEGWSWEERYADTFGLHEPRVEDSAGRATYWEKKEQLVEACECKVGIHCSGECPFVFVAIKKSIAKARRGYPEEVKSMTVEPDWEAKLRDFCERMKMPWQQPRWLLVSYWG
jgi:hypothetical protein